MVTLQINAGRTPSTIRKGIMKPYRELFYMMTYVRTELGRHMREKQGENGLHAISKRVLRYSACIMGFDIHLLQLKIYSYKGNRTIYTEQSELFCFYFTKY
jgi:hypothetical protein